MNKTSIVQERFKKIAHECLDLPLKKYGFRKKGKRYTKEENKLIYEISIDKDWYNSKDFVGFALEWGIYIPKAYLETLPFPFLAPVIAGKLSKLDPNNSIYKGFSLRGDDQNWEQNDRKDMEYLKGLIPVAVTNILAIKTIKDIINILEKTSKQYRYWETPISGGQEKDWIACMYYMIGEKKEGIKILDDMIKESKDSSFKKNLEETRDQMISGL